MSDLKVCRICLRAQCKVYKYDRFQLQAYYEEVMAQKMNVMDGLPLYFCYECATILHRFHKFKEKCRLGQRVLKQIQFSRKGNINYGAVCNVDRSVLHLKSSLQILTVSKRVKTYVVNDKSTKIKKSPEREIIEADDDEKEISIKEIEDQQMFIEEPAACDDNYDSDTPLENMRSLDTLDNITEDNKEENESTVEKFATEDSENKFDKMDCKIEVKEKALSSPETSFVDAKNNVRASKSEPVKEKPKNVSEKSVTKPKKFTKRNSYFPDKNSWKTYSLSEEEALKEFQQKAERDLYKSAPFKCLDCIKGFLRDETLKRHKQLRHAERAGKVECRFCHKRYKSDYHLHKHMTEHYMRYKCLQCDMIVCLETTAMFHEEWHKGITRRCEHCGKEFRHQSTYYTHLRTHRSGHVCTLCGMSFVSPSGLNMHMKRRHVDEKVVNTEKDDDDSTFCERCDIRFETQMAYEEHLLHSALHSEDMEEDKNTAKEIQEKQTQDSKETSSKSGDGKPTGVKQSGIAVSAKLKYGRKANQKQGYQRKPTTCIQCGKHFASQTACMKHHRAEHRFQSFYAQRHICEICGASLALGSIATHQNMHTREKEFPCELCGRKFYTKELVKRHMVTHTGEKPFPCTLCDKRFTQKGSLTLHFNTFHLKKPYPKRIRKKHDDSPILDL